MFSGYNFKSVSRGNYMTWSRETDPQPVGLSTVQSDARILKIEANEDTNVALIAIGKPVTTHVLARANNTFETRVLPPRAEGQQYFIPRADQFYCGSITFESASYEKHYITVDAEDAVALILDDGSQQRGLDASWVLEKVLRPQTA